MKKLPLNFSPFFDMTHFVIIVALLFQLPSALRWARSEHLRSPIFPAFKLLSFQLLSEINSVSNSVQKLLLRRKTDMASKFQRYSEYLRWQHAELLGAAPCVNGDCVTSFLVNDFVVDPQRGLAIAASPNAQLWYQSLKGSGISSLRSFPCLCNKCESSLFPLYTILSRKQAISCISVTKIS